MVAEWLNRYSNGGSMIVVRFEELDEITGRCLTTPVYVAAVNEAAALELLADLWAARTRLQASRLTETEARNLYGYENALAALARGSSSTFLLSTQPFLGLRREPTPT